MAGIGPLPKDPDKRVRTSKTGREKLGQTVLTFVPGVQPDLPVVYDHDGELYRWHPQTEVWWKMWTTTPLSQSFSATDWSFLLDTALIHSRFWYGDLKQAAELRQRVAKFGVTPEDRARLRIVFADADEKEERRGNYSSSAPVASGPGGYGDLSLVEND